MTLYTQLQAANSEEDVKDAYIKALGLKGYTKGLIDIQTNEIWFEAKDTGRTSFIVSPTLISISFTPCDQLIARHKRPFKKAVTCELPSRNADLPDGVIQRAGGKLPIPGQSVEPLTGVVGQKIDTRTRRVALPQGVFDARPKLLGARLAAERGENLFHHRRCGLDAGNVPPIQCLNQVILR